MELDKLDESKLGELKNAPLCWTDGPDDGRDPQGTPFAATRWLVEQDGRVLAVVRYPDTQHFAFTVQVFGPIADRYYLGEREAMQYAERAARSLVGYEALSDSLSQMEQRHEYLPRECARLNQHAETVRAWLNQQASMVQNGVIVFHH